ILQPSSHATTFWTGPNTNWTKSTSTPLDAIVPDRVVLTRGDFDVLYNVAAGESYATSTSPNDTLLAFGDIADATRLSYQTLGSLRTGNLATSILGKAMVVHLINEDIYFSIRFTIWGRHDEGTVAYTRSTPSAGVPIVGIARPFEGEIFAAPADIKVTVDA